MILVWRDGRVLSDAVEAASAAGSGRMVGCYTTARAASGGVLHLERHIARLARDAALLGLGGVDALEARRALLETARAAFAGGEGAIRLEARAGTAGGAAALVAIARALGPEPTAWRAVVAPQIHAGVSPTSRAKRTERPLFEAASAHARGAGADEALLLDRERRLVEGARSSVLVVLDSGALVTPPLSRGAQAGIGRALLLERCSELAEGDIGPEALRAARELVAVNAVRGARAIVSLDGRPVGTGAPGPWAARLDAAFRAAGEAPEPARP